MIHGGSGRNRRVVELIGRPASAGRADQRDGRIQLGDSYGDGVPLRLECSGVSGRYLYVVGDTCVVALIGMVSELCADLEAASSAFNSSAR